jgi:hypothetical protein
MVARVKISSGASSPFRVSVSGADVNSADFDQLVFDGNQMPFRIWKNGYMNANLIPAGTTGLAIATQGLLTYACPTGQFPMFNVMWRIPDGTPSDVLRTPKEVGAMINESDRNLYSLSFAKQSNSTSPGQAYCNYLIYKNYG